MRDSGHRDEAAVLPGHLRAGDHASARPLRELRRLHQLPRGAVRAPRGHGPRRPLQRRQEAVVQLQARLEARGGVGRRRGHGHGVPGRGAVAHQEPGGERRHRRVVARVAARRRRVVAERGGAELRRDVGTTNGLADLVQRRVRRPDGGAGAAADDGHEEDDERGT